MNARPEVKMILVAKKMRRWWTIARHPLYDVRVAPSRARRNCLKLMLKYPAVAAKMGITLVSLYS